MVHYTILAGFCCFSDILDSTDSYQADVSRTKLFVPNEDERHIHFSLCHGIILELFQVRMAMITHYNYALSIKLFDYVWSRRRVKANLRVIWNPWSQPTPLKRIYPLPHTRALKHPWLASVAVIDRWERDSTAVPPTERAKYLIYFLFFPFFLAMVSCCIVGIWTLDLKYTIGSNDSNSNCNLDILDQMSSDFYAS